MKANKKGTIQFSFRMRIPSEWLAIADEIASELREEDRLRNPPGRDFGRTDAFRAAIAKGFEAFDAEEKRRR